MTVTGTSREKNRLCARDKCGAEKYRDLTFCLEHTALRFKEKVQNEKLVCARGDCTKSPVIGKQGFCGTHHHESYEQRMVNIGRICVIESCVRGATREKTLCRAHYAQKVAGKDFKPSICIRGGCKTVKHAEGGRGLCLSHYREILAKEKLSRGETCSIDLCNEVVDQIGLCNQHNIQLRQGRVPFVRICTYSGCRNKPPRSDASRCLDHARTCLVGQCARPKLRGSKEYCHRHQDNMEKYGTTVEPARPWTKDKHGYIKRTRPAIEGGGVEAQHRTVMEQFLGRTLGEKENVHHKNGVRHDNRLSNLELWSVSQPAGQRAIDKLDWAREIIALYGPDEEKLNG